MGTAYCSMTTSVDYFERTTTAAALVQSTRSLPPTTSAITILQNRTWDIRQSARFRCHCTNPPPGQYERRKVASMSWFPYSPIRSSSSGPGPGGGLGLTRTSNRERGESSTPLEKATANNSKRRRHAASKPQPHARPQLRWRPHPGHSHPPHDHHSITPKRNTGCGKPRGCVVVAWRCLVLVHRRPCLVFGVGVAYWYGHCGSGRVPSRAPHPKTKSYQRHASKIEDTPPRRGAPVPAPHAAPLPAHDGPVHACTTHAPGMLEARGGAFCESCALPPWLPPMRHFVVRVRAYGN